MTDHTILPSEVQAREFDAKLLTACFLAERGLSAIVGARHHIHNHLARLPANVYLAKDIASPSRRILSMISEMGMQTALLDEEALVFTSTEGYLSRRVDPKAASLIDRVYAWGPRSAELMTHLPGATNRPLIETGNPRMDLLRPELRAFHDRAMQAIAKTHGPIILFNSNFGMLNPMTYAKNRRPEVLKVQHPDILALMERRREAYRAFVDLLPQIARAFPDHQLIIRPHPAESPSAWQSVVDATANCQIVTSGQLIPWLSTAVATLHNGCTTGFESFLMGKVSISYRGVAHAPDDTLSPDLFSQILDQPDEVITAIKARIDGRAPAPAETQKAALARHLRTSDSQLAAERLAEELASFPDRSQALRLDGRIKAEIRGWEKTVKGLVPSNKASAKSNAHRYPGVSVAMINEKLADLRHALGRFEDVQATPLGRDIYRIQPKQ